VVHPRATVATAAFPALAQELVNLVNSVKANPQQKAPAKLAE
jgi:hypothetical protein